jgi:enoyl-CoA hydratase/carnithine racemase
MSPMPGLDRRGDVFVLDLGDDGNAFTPELIATLMELLDEVAAAAPPRALVTAASGKSWALGLDLGWIDANRSHMDELVQAMHRLDARVLELDVPTVAAIQGHAFAGGALFALAHDYRVMNPSRGFFCLPEIDGHIAFTPGMAALVRARLSPQVAHVALTSGKRYGGREALACGVVDSLAEEDGVVAYATELAATLADKDPTTLGRIKSGLYRDVLAVLRDADANRVAIEDFGAALAMQGQPAAPRN